MGCTMKSACTLNAYRRKYFPCMEFPSLVSFVPSFLFQKNLNGHKVVVNSFLRNINVLYLYSLDKRYNSLKINSNSKKVLFVCLFLESYSQNVLLVPWRICIIGTGEETKTKICPQ